VQLHHMHQMKTKAKDARKRLKQQLAAKEARNRTIEAAASASNHRKGESANHEEASRARVQR
jgi:hypothetical protein